MNLDLMEFLVEIIYLRIIIYVLKDVKNDAYVINLDEYHDIGTH